MEIPEKHIPAGTQCVVYMIEKRCATAVCLVSPDIRRSSLAREVVVNLF